MVLILYAMLGAILGSFATFLIYRFSYDEPVVRVKQQSSLSPHRSACTSCEARLGLFELIPIFSWIVQRGRCRTCAAPISKLYPITEIVCAAIACVTFLRFGVSIEGIVILVSIPVLYALLVVDLRRLILPDPLMAVFCICAVLYTIFLAMTAWGSGGFNAALSVAVHHVFASVLYGGLAWGLARAMAMALKKEALGFGDVKFFAIAGLWLGVGALPLFLILSGVFGVAFGGLWRIIKAGQANGNLFPFGPALIVSFLTLLFYHEYLNTLIL